MTTENVVNYTVVIAVENPQNQLLPGMTATVDLQVAKATDVLRVANAELRRRATEAMQAAVRVGREGTGGAMAAGAAGTGRLWYVAGRHGDGRLT